MLCHTASAHEQRENEGDELRHDRRLGGWEIKLWSQKFHPAWRPCSSLAPQPTLHSYGQSCVPREQRSTRVCDLVDALPAFVLARHPAVVLADCVRSPVERVVSGSSADEEAPRRPLPCFQRVRDVSIMNSLSANHHIHRFTHPQSSSRLGHTTVVLGGSPVPPE